MTINKPKEAVERMKANCNAEHSVLSYLGSLEIQLRQCRSMLKKLRDVSGPAARIRRIGYNDAHTVHDLIDEEVSRIDKLLGLEGKESA